MDYKLLLNAKMRSAAEVAATVRTGDRLDYGFALSEPDLFDAALAARKSELRDVVIRGALSLRPRPAGSAAAALYQRKLALLRL